MDIETIRKKYAEKAIAHYEAINNGDSKTANKAGAELRKLKNDLSADRKLAEAIIVPMLNSENIYLKQSAAVSGLMFGIETQVALNIMEEHSKRHDIGFLSRLSDMTLSLWREGRLGMELGTGENFNSQSVSKTKAEHSDPKIKLKAWKVGELATLYYEEVMNGGHEQYFKNHPEIDSRELINALEALRATQFLDIFNKSLNVNQSGINKDNGFDKLDNEFYEIKPELVDIAEKYLADHEGD